MGRPRGGGLAAALKRKKKGKKGDKRDVKKNSRGISDNKEIVDADADSEDEQVVLNTVYLVASCKSSIQALTHMTMIPLFNTTLSVACLLQSCDDLFHQENENGKVAEEDTVLKDFLQTDVHTGTLC